MFYRNTARALLLFVFITVAFLPPTMPNTTIKRFTYDWLIRFAELVPSDKSKEKVRNLSPRFTNLVDKYHKFKLQPFLYITNGTNVEELLHSPNGDVWIPTNLLLWNVTQPGVVSTIMTSKVSLSNIKIVSVRGCELTMKELMYLVQSCPTCELTLDGVLTEPAYFSAIQPYLLSTAHIHVNLMNLIYDYAVPYQLPGAAECMYPDALRSLTLCGIDFNNAELLLNVVLSLPKSKWSIQFNGFNGSARMTTGSFINDKLRAVGIKPIWVTRWDNSLTCKML